MTEEPRRKRNSLRAKTGLVAILDALGAADYSMERVRDYLDSRRQLREEVTKFAEKEHRGLAGGFSKARLDWFVFQDTIILVYLSRQNHVAVDEVAWFGLVLRAFVARAIGENLLFRGAFAAGQLYEVSNKDNTVLGPAVRDAARWFEQADWMGVHATPRTTLLIHSLTASSEQAIDFALVPYAVPLKQPLQGGEFHCVNWPKGLHLRHPKDNSRRIRGRLASCLAHDDIPRGVERKQFHALEFFDRIVERQELEESWNVRVNDPNAKNPAKR